MLDGTTDLPHTQKAKRALAIMALVVGAAATGLTPISVSSVVGLGLMIATGCLELEGRDQRSVDPGGHDHCHEPALGKALLGTGMADYLAP